METINNIEWHVGNYDEIVAAKPLQPFADEVLDDLNRLSAAILHDPLSRQYPDVVTFAFFCRKANLSKLREEYGFGDTKIENRKSNNETTIENRKSKIHLGRGLIFHIAPSNVPVNFAYSMVAGLLAGNTNVVRVSQKEFPQVDIIVKHMREIGMHRVAVVRYPHESNANELFSADCAVRVIWGGDATIARIRECALPARAFDICFADRYSIAAINANALIADYGLPMIDYGNSKIDNQQSKIESTIENRKSKILALAERFYNDTYLFDQNACSAPHLVVWTGNKVEEAKQLFWDAVQQVAEQKYQFQEVMAVDKLTALYKQSCAMPTCEEQTKNNLLRRAEIAELPCDIDSFRCAGGYFTEYTAQSLDEIAPIVNTKYQTLAYFGFEHDELHDFVLRNRLTGFDRIVPFGETTTFSLTWDGMNLIERMSRIVDVL